MKLTKSILAAAITATLAISAQAASTIFVGADATTNPIELLTTGALVPTGNLVRVGTFSITDSQVIANKDNFTFLNTNFQELDTFFMGEQFGDGITPGFNGRFENPAVEGSNALVNSVSAGKPIYLWMFNRADTGTAAPLGNFDFAGGVEHGIFRSFGATPTAFKTDTQVGNGDDFSALAFQPVNATDFVGNIVSDGSNNGGIVVGGFDSIDSQYQLYTPTPVPEPSTALFGLLTIVSAAGLRRHRAQRA